MLTACGGGSGTAASQAAGGNGGASASEQTFNLKLSHGLAEDHAVHIQLTAFADAVREKTGGEINIEVVPNGTLGSEGAVLEQVGYGMVEMTKVSAATLGNFASEWNALSVPYVFNDHEHYYNVMDGEIAKDLYLTTEDQGFIGLFLSLIHI